jgi:hypothetical protein
MLPYNVNHDWALKGKIYLYHDITYNTTWEFLSKNQFLNFIINQNSKYESC